MIYTRTVSDYLDLAEKCARKRNIPGTLSYLEQAERCARDSGLSIPKERILFIRGIAFSQSDCLF